MPFKLIKAGLKTPIRLAWISCFRFTTKGTAKLMLSLYRPERIGIIGRRYNVGTWLRNPGPITPKIVGTLIKAQGSYIRFLRFFGSGISQVEHWSTPDSNSSGLHFLWRSRWYCWWKNPALRMIRNIPKNLRSSRQCRIYTVAFGMSNLEPKT